MKDTNNLHSVRWVRSGAACLIFLITIPLIAISLWLTTRVSRPVEVSHQGTTSIQTLLIVTISVMIFTIIPVIIGYMIIRRRASRLDEIFLPLGFTGRRFMMNGRQYSRKTAGGEITIWIFKGPSLDIRIPVPVNAAFRVFRRNSIPVQMARFVQTPSYQSRVPELEGLAFYPGNIPWLEDFLGGVRATGAIRTLLMEGAEWAEYRQLELFSGELCFHLYESKTVNTWPLDQQTVNRWITSLEDLAAELQNSGLPALNPAESPYPGGPATMIDRTATRLAVMVIVFFLITGIVLFFFIMWLTYNT